jgi:FkbM family methyltransferase
MIREVNITFENQHIRLKKCRYGPMLYLPHDQYIGQALDRYGEFSEGEAYFFRSLIKPGWTILDVGANQGAHTIALARIAKAVYAFEPQRILFQILCANVALNALTNVHTYQVGVGSEAGTIGVPNVDYTKPANFGAVELGEGERVPLITIDSLALPECHFMKVDVEGMEGDVIAGAKETIQYHQPILYLENDRDDKSPALIEQLWALDYRLYWHLPFYFNTNNFFGETENVYGRTISANMLGIHMSQHQQIKLREVTSPQDTWRG